MDNNLSNNDFNKIDVFDVTKIKTETVSMTYINILILFVFICCK